MRVGYHIITSVIISGILYAVFKSWTLTWVSLLSGIFIDLDHVLDYVMVHKLRFDIRHFFHYYHKRLCKKAFLLLHSWELLTALGVAAMLTDWDPWVTGIFIGFSQHMFFDQLFNGSASLSYFLIWRWKVGFDHEKICPTSSCGIEKK